MNPLAERKHGFGDVWQSISDGWRDLRERAASAVTRFVPSSHAAPQRAGEAATSGSLDDFPSSWGVLAGDVYEQDDAVVVRLEAPGMRKEDFALEVRNGALVVRGEKRITHEGSEGRYRIRQCAFGSFQRVIPLPTEVIAEQASARYSEGVLRIELPKSERARSRRITIEAS